MIVCLVCGTVPESAARKCECGLLYAGVLYAEFLVDDGDDGYLFLERNWDGEAADFGTQYGGDSIPDEEVEDRLREMVVRSVLSL